ncbi:hypothetical protein T11_286 [Trichinella zimbabwensis]|uniref:Uncharacterized protein n=1 Tax=Trichinella zimbabwensis TaxID=268475 RepID=A0A0V1HBJ7_9BILA|nr:hypothetical protein T11_286 [Trichinella zimbabwensis]
MANDVEDTLCRFLRSAQLSLRLDESTLPGKLPFARWWVTDTTGQSIFLVVAECFKEKEIPLRNLIAVATGRALSMVACHSGFIAHLKKSVLDVFRAHCAVC